MTTSVDPNTGQLTYATTTNKKGKTVAQVATDSNGKQIGSKAARKKLMKAIGNKKTLNVFASSKTNSVGGGLQMNLNSGQINDFIKGTSSDLDSRTMGFGMTFLHELTHTDIGGNLSDPQTTTLPNGSKVVPFGQTGATVNFMNTVRGQLNQQGGNFGTRTSYGKMPINGLFYVPFSTKSSGLIQRGIVPATERVETTK